MKKVMLIALALATITACKDNPVSKKIKETKENVSNTKKAVEEINEIQKDIQELQEEEPLTNEELKEWLPEEIAGMKRTGYKAGHMGVMKIASIEGTYSNEDKSKKFKVEVIDGAGVMGASATAGMRMILSQDFEEEDEYRSKRTVKKNGVKAIEQYVKNNNKSTLEFLQDERFYIKVTGTNLDVEETWDAVDELKTDKLG